MRKALSVPSVRPEAFARFMASVEATPSLADWAVYPLFQCYGDEARRWAGHPRIPQSWTSDQPISPWVGRRWIYRHTEQAPDVWVAADDDIEFLPDYTDLNSAALKAVEVGVGCVSSNFARVPALLRRSRYERRFIEQPIVNTSGGMAYGPAVVALMLEGPDTDYLFDDIEAPLRAYVHGMVNYRWLGSLAIHAICTTGGLQVMYRQRAMVLPDKALITLHPSRDRHANGNNYHIPGSRDLTTLAHAQHRQARASKYGLSAV